MDSRKGKERNSLGNRGGKKVRKKMEKERNSKCLVSEAAGLRVLGFQHGKHTMKWVKFWVFVPCHML